MNEEEAVNPNDPWGVGDDGEKPPSIKKEQIVEEDSLVELPTEE